MNKPLTLAVRTVVEHVCRCGDIDSRFAGPSAMQEGAWTHRWIQKSMGPEYHKEVSLKLATTVGDIAVILQGRADGIIYHADGSITVDEIKSTTLPLDVFYAQHPLHLAQAKCYAWMLLPTLETVPTTLTLQLTYAQLETGELRRHQFPVTAEELEGFWHNLIAEYGKWLIRERDWRKVRQTACKSLTFPFPRYREGQRKLSAAVYHNVLNEGNIYIQAPTGIGKTVSTLFPVLKAMGAGKGERAFYLTAKTVTRALAEDAIRLMEQKGLRIKSITLRAKEKLCLTGESRCTPDYCPWARGHYDRVNEGVLDILSAHDVISPQVVVEYARKHRLCPHEFSLDIATWCDVIIGDYNHVFDPGAYLRRFFASEEGGDYIFLIDEAHNLGDRVRDMYTASVHKSDFARIRGLLTGDDPRSQQLRLAMGNVESHLLDVRRGMEESIAVERTVDDALVTLLTKFTTAAADWLGKGEGANHPAHPSLLQLYFDGLFYQDIAQIFSNAFAAITEIQGNQMTSTLFCLDPSSLIRARLEQGRAAVFFSATLTPLSYYRDLLGGSADDDLLSLDSPFDPDKLRLVAYTGISTKYRDRQTSYFPIAQAIAATVDSRPGNYMVYFPSYEYMDNVLAAFHALGTGIPLVVQQRAMDDKARETFLASFEANTDTTFVGFCVMGGIFSEGIDLKGDRLIGTIVVGVGLPMITLRRNLIRDYYDQHNGNGYSYAYIYPGMNKVLQAAGRVIRTEEDTGTVLLIDQRFGTREYRRLYPRHWGDLVTVANAGELEEALKASRIPCV